MKRKFVFVAVLAVLMILIASIALAGGPSASKVTGGGWVPYGDDGRINFGFVVQQAEDGVLSGNLNVVFHLPDGNFTLKSPIDYDPASSTPWEYAVNGTYVVKGVDGVVGDLTDVHWRIVGDEDSFGIRLWHSSLGVFFDTLPADPLGGGSIQIR